VAPSAPLLPIVSAALLAPSPSTASAVLQETLCARAPAAAASAVVAFVTAASPPALKHQRVLGGARFQPTVDRANRVMMAVVLRILSNPSRRPLKCALHPVIRRSCIWKGGTKRKSLSPPSFFALFAKTMRTEWGREAELNTVCVVTH
jgi:hypothetical protein